MNYPKRILIVDDEPFNVELMEALVASFGHEPESAHDGFEALDKVNEKTDLILMDVMMPEMDGFEVTRRIREESDFRDVPIVMVTGLSSSKDRLRAVKVGANDFISKPVDRIELKVRIESLLKMKEAQDDIKRHKATLEETVQKRTASLQKALDELNQAQAQIFGAYLDTLHRLSIASEFKDEGTAEHIRRMSNYCAIIALHLGLPPREVELIHNASPMHDVGKIGIPDAIILKPDRLNADEWDTMQQHSIIGARILSGSSSELLQVGELIAMSHHEKWDGTGYPQGLAGKDIPLYGRICAVADVFDALTSRRPYKEAFSNEKAFTIMAESRGTHFDPEILDVFFKLKKEIIEIQKKYIEES